MRQITSVQHPLVKHLIKLRQNRDYRYEHQRVIVEGIKPIADLSKHIRFINLISRDESLTKGLSANETIIVSESVLKKVSGMQSPEGVLAEIAMPKPSSLANLQRIVAFDGINDPGNLGTLLRTALALGWEGAYILDESCDPFNEKALRSACGATFQLPLGWGGWEQLEQLIQKNKLKPLVADLEGHALEDVDVNGGVLLVLGNEARGISLKAKAICEAVTIPMSGKMESLNVAIAGGIMMYVLKSLSPN